AAGRHRSGVRAHLGGEPPGVVSAGQHRSPAGRGAGVARGDGAAGAAGLERVLPQARAGGRSAVPAALPAWPPAACPAGYTGAGRTTAGTATGHATTAAGHTTAGPAAGDATARRTAAGTPAGGAAAPGHATAAAAAGYAAPGSAGRATGELNGAGSIAASGVVPLSSKTMSLRLARAAEVWSAILISRHDGGGDVRAGHGARRPLPPRSEERGVGKEL